jgi:hypothetical protein
MGHNTESKEERRKARNIVKRQIKQLKNEFHNGIHTRNPQSGIYLVFFIYMDTRAFYST